MSYLAPPGVRGNEEIPVDETEMSFPLGFPYLGCFTKIGFFTVLYMRVAYSGLILQMLRRLLHPDRGGLQA